MTTADYLESLQDDLDRTVTALDLEEGTNFTDIADMAENGDISTGGGADLSEYFTTEITTTTSKPVTNLIKKYSDIIVDDNVTSLQNLFGETSFNNIPAPKVICNNNVTDMAFMFYKALNCTSIDMTGIDASNVTTLNGIFYVPSVENKLTNINFGSNFNTTSVTNMREMFYMRQGLTSLDLSSFETPVLNTVLRMFGYCINLRFIDMRKMTLDAVPSLSTSGMFGASANNGVPNDCEIIVKDETQKNLITNAFSRLTNVKTVAEYEAE